MLVRRLAIGAVSWCVLLLASTPMGTAAASTGTWRSHGPIGGAVESLAVAPSSPNVVYAASAGVWVSTNGGRRWRDSGGGPFDSSLAVAVDPADPSSVYLSGFEHLWKSTDGGAHWTATSYNSHPAQQIIIDPSDPGTVFLREPQGIWRSVDGGGTWERVLFVRTIGVFSLAMDPGHPEDLYAGARLANSGGQAVVFRSTDGGSMWISSSTGLPHGDLTSLAVADGSPAIVYAAGDNGVFQSTDGGATWFESDSGLPPGSTTDVVVNPVTPSQVFVVSNGTSLYQTGDAGATWSATGLYSVYIRALAIDPVTPTTLYSTGFLDQPVVRSTDGGATWEPASRGFAEANARSLTAAPSAPGTVFAVAQQVATSTDDGKSWTYLSEPGFFDASVAVAPSDADVLYFGRDRSRNAGVTWKAMPLPSNGAASQPAYAVDLSDSTHVFAAVQVGGVQIQPVVYESPDSGKTWTGLAGSTLGVSGDPTAFVIDPSDPQIMYAVLSWGGTGEASGVFKTGDGGATWGFASSGLPSNIALNGLALDPATADTLYLATGAGIYKSVDGAETWSPAQTGLTADDVRSVAVNPAMPATVYAGTFGGGVFRSTDAGATWKMWNGGLRDLSVQSLAVDSNGAFVHVGTAARGVFDRPA